MNHSPEFFRKGVEFVTKHALIASLALVISAGSATSAFAITLSQIQNNIQAIINGSNSNVTWSVLIENEYGTQTYFDLNSNTPRRPASNTKIFTTAAAFESLGASYVWQGFQLGSSSNSSPVHDILTFSDNGQADSLYSLIGGNSTIISTMTAAGIDMTGAVAFDGSGLSYSNRFTARQTLQAVKFMDQNYTFNQWGTHLAVGCQSGTLGSRFCGTNGSGNVYAKTGTLTNGQVLSLSGFADNPFDGEIYYFSIYTNNVPSSSQSDTRSRMDSIVNVMTGSGIPNPGQTLGGIIVDNGTSGYSETGSWGTSTSAGFYGSNSRWASAFSGNNTAKWTPTITTQGIYSVYVRYVAGSNRSPAASYVVSHLNGSTLLFGNDNGDGIINGLNQQSNGAQWIKIGEWEFASGTSGNVLLDSVGSFNGGLSNTVVSADAVQFVLEQATVTEVVVDNSDAGFTKSSNWFPSTSVSGYLGSNYHARATQSISDSGKYNVTLPTSGTYKVEARWTTGANRATSTPYVITHNGGNSTVNVNQQNNNGTWVTLGTYSFNAGTAQRVQVSCWTSSGAYVIADGIRFTKQ